MEFKFIAFGAGQCSSVLPFILDDLLGLYLPEMDVNRVNILKMDTLLSKMIRQPESWKRQKCKCCNGSGTQERDDGIVIECPCCNGTGYKQPEAIF